MRYIIDNFEFDSESLVLEKNGESIAIRHNEAKLLALLLESKEKLLSKEDILAHVWQDKVVSEQAVFQNISHLRNLFGNNAIKTFPKRGYQWQLNTSLTQKETLSTESESVILKPSQVIKTTSAAKRPFWLVAALVSFALICIIGIYNISDTDNQKFTAPIIQLAYIPFASSNSEMKIELTDNAIFDFTTLNHLDSDHFINSAELEYPKLVKQHPFVLTGHIRSYQQQIHLDFLLKGPSGNWQGQLSGKSVIDINKLLQQHLKQRFIYHLLSKPQSLELRQAQLVIAHQQTPTDLITLGMLINTYTSMEELEKAMVLADKLAGIAAEQQDNQQVGNALLYQSGILTRKELYELSLYKLESAIKQFKQINDLKRQADAWYAQSWLNHQEEGYIAVKSSLLKSAQLALQAKDVSRELNALTYLSVMAHKHHQENDRYHYLNQAESKMKVYQLPIYHFAKVPFHYAIFAKKMSDKEPHLKQVLEFTKLTPNNWVANESRKQLLEHYIEQDRLNEAQLLLDNINTDTVHNSFLKTLLAQSKQETDIFIKLAKQTFEKAQLSGNRGISLDIALLLCSEKNPQINGDFYSQYIHDKAPKYWLKMNKTKLLALNL